MPLKSIIIVFALVGLASIVKPAWTMFFVWAGGMALLWIITGQWTPPSPHKRAQENQPFASEAEQIKPMEASMEAEDLDDLQKLDGSFAEASDLDEFDEEKPEADDSKKLS